MRTDTLPFVQTGKHPKNDTSSFVHDLEEEAISHRAVNHPYLQALIHDGFSNPHLAIQDFAAQYGAYSAWFPRYLTGVISRLENPEFRNHLLDNLAEESGRLHDDDLEKINALGIKTEWVQGVPHPELFKRFQKAIGIKPNVLPGVEVQIWREMFLNVIQNGSPEEAVGAIGLGTESVVKYIYRHLIEAIERHTSLSLEEYVFFPLHTEVDDEHGKILLGIAEEMGNKSGAAREKLRKGMLKALNLRSAYWDDMMERALRIKS